MPDFRMQQNSFPIASVIDAAQRNNQLQLQARTQGQQSLIEGMKAIGQVGQSLYDQKMRIAQALAQSELYKKTHPELFNKVETVTKSQAPINRSETASFDPSTGTVTPNTGMSGVAGQVPLTRRVESNGSFSIPDQTLLDAFMGMQPKDFFDNQVQNRAAKTSEGDLALKRQTEPQKIDLEGRKAMAEIENAQVMRQIQAMLAQATIKNNEAERAQAAENAAFDADKEAAKHPFLNFKGAMAANKRISAVGARSLNHSAALDWAKKNPNDPRSAVIMQRATQGL